MTLFLSIFVFYLKKAQQSWKYYIFYIFRIVMFALTGITHGVCITFHAAEYIVFMNGLTAYKFS